jgi:hypothetical protein
MNILEGVIAGIYHRLQWTGRGRNTAKEWSMSKSQKSEEWYS